MKATGLRLFRFRVATKSGGRDMRVVATSARDVITWCKGNELVIVQGNNIPIKVRQCDIESEPIDEVLVFGYREEP